MYIFVSNTKGIKLKEELEKIKFAQHINYIDRSNNLKCHVEQTKGLLNKNYMNYLKTLDYDIIVFSGLFITTSGLRELANVLDARGTMDIQTELCFIGDAKVSEGFFWDEVGDYYSEVYG